MPARARRDEVQGFAKNESIAWPWESDKQAAFHEFERMWNLIGITSTKEGGCNITCYKDQVFPKEKEVVPALPAVASGNLETGKRELRAWRTQGMKIQQNPKYTSFRNAKLS